MDIHMSSSLAQFTAPSSSTRPLSLFNHARTHFKLYPPTVTGTRRRVFQLKALQGSEKRRTLSSNWNLSRVAKPPPSFTSFEDLDTTNMLLRQRIIFISHMIYDEPADFVISQLLLLDAQDSQKDIKLFINAHGGSITSGMGIYDAMKLCKADISTICMGMAASVGAFLLASGTKGKRYCMPNSKVRINHPPGTVTGSVTDNITCAREISYHAVKVNKILSRITGKPEQQIDIDTASDKFMNPWEAKEYGLVDAVIDDGKPGLVAPIADAIPPPKTRICDLWKFEGFHRGMILPSEHNLFQKAYAEGQSNDDDKGSQQEKETPSSV